MARKLVIEILGDASSLERSYRRAGAATRNFERGIGRSTRGAVVATGAFRGLGRSIAFASTAFLGGAGFVYGVKESIGAINTLRLAQARATQEFGSSAGVIQSWAKTSSSALALPQAEAIKFADNIGQLLLNMGKTRPVAAAMAAQLVTLTGRIAAMRQMDPAQVFQRLQAAVAGRAVGLKQLGFLIDQNAVKEEALRTGIVRASKSTEKIRTATLDLAIARHELAQRTAKYGAGDVRVVQAQERVRKATLALQKAQAGTVGTLTAQQKGAATLSLVLRQSGFVTDQWRKTQHSTAVESAKFRAHIEDLKASIGAALEPTVRHYLGIVNRWLASSENQRKVTKAVRDAVHLLGGALDAATSVARPLAKAISGVADSLGGWKTALELAAGAWVGFKVAGIVAAGAVQAANMVAAGVVSSTWKAALISTGWGALAVAAGAAAAYVMTHWSKAKIFFQKLGLDISGTILTALYKVTSFLENFKIATPFGVKDLFPGIGGATKYLGGQLDIITSKMHDLNVEAAAASKTPVVKWATGKFAKPPAGGYAQTPGFSHVPAKKTTTRRDTKNDVNVTISTWRDAWDKVAQGFQLAMSKAGLTKSLRDDLKVLQKWETSLRHQLSLHKGDVELQSQLVDLIGQRRDIEAQIAQNAADTRNRRQFRGLGLTATGDEPVAGVRQLRGQLSRVSTAIEGTFLDTKKTRTLISRIRRVLSGGLGAVGRDVRAKIHEILSDLDQQLKDKSGDVTKWHAASTAKILGGLGLTPDQLREARTRLAQLGYGGTVPSGGKAFALAGPTVYVNGGLHLHGVQDPRGFEDAMGKRSRSRPNKRRGGSSGGK